MTKNTGTLTKYVELYKKHRPTTWDEVIGQDAIVNDLRQAVADNRIPTAYLFSGPRGTGKTTNALILAKAINCENPDGKGNPCNKCETCMAIDDGQGDTIGVNYISAANNGSVDEIREIMNRAHRAAHVRKPVWIIDEVHRLSQSGFDSLLIPLEDTSLPALFIFCTTELNKVPTTITSRVQHRAFKLVDSQSISHLCAKLLEEDGYHEVPDDELTMIAHEDSGKPYDERRKVYSKGMVRQAIRLAGVTSDGGSVRQTLSILDQLLADPTYKYVNWSDRIAGSTFGKNNIPAAIMAVSQAIAAGEDARSLTMSMVDYARELVILSQSDTIDSSKTKRQAAAKRLGTRKLLYALKRLGIAQRDQLTAGDARLYLELALIDIGEVFKGDGTVDLRKVLF